MKKVIGYLRVSTGSQDVKRQKMLISEFAKKEGYELIKFISDEGVSGTIDEREGLNNLYTLTVSDCDMVVITEFSRFSRKSSMIAVANDIKSIVDKGIDIHVLNTNKTITKGFDEEIIDVLTLIIESNGAAKERARIIERMQSGKQSAAKHKPLNVSGPNNVFGYTTNSNKQIVINPEEAEIVKDIFIKYANGWGSNDIYKYLITNNIAPQKKWTHAEISKTIKRDRYIGYYRCNIGGEKIEKYYKELQIIDNELFDLANKARLKNKTTRGGKPTTHNADAVLRDVMKCPYCGGEYSLNVSNGIVKYRCLNSTPRSIIKCKESRYLQHKLYDNAVIKAISSDAIIQRVNDNANEILGNNTKHIEELKAKNSVYTLHIEELKLKWKKYFDKAIKFDISDEDIAIFKGDIDKQIDNNNTLIKDNLNTIKKLNSVNNHISNLSDNTFNDMINEVNGDRGKAKQLVNEFVDVIYVWGYDKFILLQIIRKDGNEQYIFIKLWTL
ncbi:MAG: recombinase family protein [Bacteroidales bacterium]